MGEWFKIKMKKNTVLKELIMYQMLCYVYCYREILDDFCKIDQRGCLAMHTAKPFDKFPFTASFEQ